MDLHVPMPTARRLWAMPGAVFAGVARPAVVNGRLVSTPGVDVVPMPCPSFLIEHDRGLVLFDTGVSPKGLADPEHYFPDIARQFGFDCDPELGVDAQLRALGYRSEQVQYVVPSHLHFDHAGGLFLFPHATFLIGAGEMGFAYHPERGAQAYFLLDDIAPTRSFRWIETDRDFDLFGDGSVRILFSPGHTPGSLALFVRLPNRNLILTGDTCHFRTEVESGIVMPSAINDHVDAHASLHRLTLIRDAWDAQIWVGHDIDDWNAWPHAPDHID